MIYQTARLKYRPATSRGRVAARRDQGLLQLRRLQREAAGPTSRASCRRARSTSSGRASARNVTARRLLPPAAEPQHLPRGAARDRGAPGLGRAARRLAAPSGSPRRRARSCRRSPASARRCSAAESHAFAHRRLHPSKGFLVLNSWGRDWGGWSPGGGAAADPGRRALALRATGPTASWTAGCCASASARPTPSTIRSATRGSASGPTPPARSTPVHAILGNFLHLDDGEFVTHGRHVSSRRTLEETERLLTEEEDGRYRGVLLTFAGGLLGLKRGRRADRALEAAGAAGRAGTRSPCSGASTTSSRRAPCSTGSSPRR